LVRDPTNAPVFEISRGMEGVLAALQQCGVRRLVMTSGMGVTHPSRPAGAMDRVIAALLGLTARNVAEDMRRAVGAVRASDLDWTVLRAPRLTDKPGGGVLKYGYVGRGSASSWRAPITPGLCWTPRPMTSTYARCRARATEERSQTASLC
jgi:hypothetical protein